MMPLPEQEQTSESPAKSLDALHHIAIQVDEIAAAVNWYKGNFRCEVTYQDETWAMLKFANVLMALVVPGQHPPHVAFTSPHAEQFGDLRTHRDGTRSVYTSDPFNNVIEMMDAESCQQAGM